MDSFAVLRQALSRHELDHAVAAAAQLPDRHPEATEAARLLVPPLLKAGRAEQALALVESAMRHKPNVPWLADLRLQVLQTCGDAAQLRQALKHRFELTPENPEALARYLAALDPLEDEAAIRAARLEHEAHAAYAMERLPPWQEPPMSAPGPHPAGLRRLYLDLLERTVCNWIYGDPQNRLGQMLPFEAARREAGKDIPAQAHTMIGLKRLRHLRVACEEALARGVPGDFVEAGVWRGGACILMAGVLKAWGDTTRRVVAADSFSGLPAPDPRFEKDALTAFDFHLRPELAVGVDEVRANFERYGLWGPNVTFLQGLFKDTLPRYPYGAIAVLRMDGDLYSSTMDTLRSLYPRVSIGGCVISDDYGVVIDARRAVLDFRAEQGIRDEMVRIDGDAVAWSKG